MTTDETRPCRIEGCEKPRQRGRVVCSMHAARIARHGDPDIVKNPKRPARGVCIVEGCGRPDHGPHGYCDKHRTRMRRHGDPETVKKAPRRIGPESPRWTGADATYSATHQRVRKVYGPASQHLCCHCMNYASQWAYDHNDPAERTSPTGLLYSTDPARYIPLCTPCHKRFDMAFWPEGESHAERLAELTATRNPNTERTHP